MTATDTIRYLSQHPITVLGEQWSPDNVSRQSAYAQYKRRFPARKSNSLHYEVEKQDDNIHVKVVLHCEGGTDNRDDVLNRLKWTPRHTTDRSKIVDCSLYTPANADDLVTEIGNQMSQIAAVYEPRIQGIENNWGAIANGHQGIDAVGVNVPVGGNENSAESDVSIEDISLKKGKPMAIGSSDSAAVSFDLQRWVQAEYADGVKSLSDIGDGVHSWVSTVEDLAKKSPVKINDALVKPGILMIPPYQRKFAWREHDVRQLCRDLLKTDNEGHYHLGTIILHHQRMDDGREIWNVVDGQQRLTNIMAILRAPIFDLPIKQFLARDYEMIRQVLADYLDDEQTKIRDRLSNCTLAFISVENVTEAFQLFTTQNGRGKPLTPVNLLKAYHYKEMDLDRKEMTEKDFGELLKESEQSWESANVASIPSAPGDGKLLLHVFREYLFRLRLWSRGKFPQIPFNARDIGEFKGVSIKVGEQGLPLQNGAVLRRSAADNGDYVARRRADDTMSPYVSIGQTIVNGADFFKYVRSYVDAYKDVFCDGRVKDFHDFYVKNCDPLRHRSGASMYARHVFEALCMFCYDRFGVEGVRKCYPALYACAYYERVSQSRVLYRKCGVAYVPKAMEAMMTTFSAEDAQLALNELRTEVRLALANSNYLKSLLKKNNPTKGEVRQLDAYKTIAG